MAGVCMHMHFNAFTSGWNYSKATFRVAGSSVRVQTKIHLKGCVVSWAIGLKDAILGCFL